jgi:hypothetical protein
MRLVIQVTLLSRTQYATFRTTIIRRSAQVVAARLTQPASEQYWRQPVREHAGDNERNPQRHIYVIPRPHPAGEPPSPPAQLLPRMPSGRIHIVASREHQTAASETDASLKASLIGIPNPRVPAKAIEDDERRHADIKRNCESLRRLEKPRPKGPHEFSLRIPVETGVTIHCVCHWCVKIAPRFVRAGRRHKRP